MPSGISGGGLGIQKQLVGRKQELAFLERNRDTMIDLAQSNSLPQQYSYDKSLE